VYGQLISGRYQLEAVLGRGGMATVWRGVDQRLGRPVAVKLLDRADTADPAMLHRFDREARTAGGLTHPNIVAVYDVGTHDGVPYLVMELINGTSVAALLASGPLPVDQAVDVARQTCDALAMTHAQGVVHRDIKPANILLTTTTGTVKVCDFGIARLAHQQTNLTAPHTAIGTSAYMAPEQASGAPVDARTDLYALGCVMYAMLTGHPPFTGDNPLAVLWQHQHQPALSVASLRPDTPAELDALITRLLAKDPSDRPATATEVRDRLTAYAESKSAAAQPTRALPVASPTQTLPVLNHSEEPAAAAGGRFRLGPAGIAAVALGAAILAAITVALLIASPGTDAASTGTANPPPSKAATAPGTTTPDSSAENPGTDSTSTGTPGPTAAETFTDNPGTDASARLAALFGVIEEQRQAGQLDGTTADELTKKLEQVGREVNKGDTGKAAEKLADLRSKLDELHQDGKITSAGYDAVQASLTQLADTLPSSGKDESGEDE
jgi:serine/threonine protein kinase